MLPLQESRVRPLFGLSRALFFERRVGESCCVLWLLCLLSFLPC